MELLLVCGGVVVVGGEGLSCNYLRGLNWGTNSELLHPGSCPTKCGSKNGHRLQEEHTEGWRQGCWFK